MEPARMPRPTRAITTRRTRKREPRPRPRGNQVIRLFNVYYPMRTLVLLVVEALVVGLSFVLGMLGNLGWLRFNNALFIEDGYLKVFVLTGLVLLLSHGFDLYDSTQLGAK